MFLNIFDSHTHSENSVDAQHSVTFMCESAIKNGVVGFSVTDHCEMDTYKEERFDVLIKHSMFDVSKVRRIFSDKLIVTAGIELSQPLSNLALTDEVLSDYDFDFVLGSLHRSSGSPDFSVINFKKDECDIPNLLRMYYEEMYQTALWNKFDVLAHITYPMRYILGKHNIYVDMSPYKDLIAEIFKVLIKNGKGIEINTSGLRDEIGVTLPDIDYLELYRDLGGEIFTIGSDAHQAEYIGADINDVMRLMESIGYKYFSFYKMREPIMLKIY